MSRPVQIVLIALVALFVLFAVSFAFFDVGSSNSSGLEDPGTTTSATTP
jgi:hypothetical protein